MSASLSVHTKRRNDYTIKKCSSNLIGVRSTVCECVSCVSSRRQRQSLCSEKFVENTLTEIFELIRVATEFMYYKWMQQVIIIINNYHEWPFAYTQHCFTHRAASAPMPIHSIFFFFVNKLSSKVFWSGAKSRNRKKIYRKSKRNAKLSVDDEDGESDEERTSWINYLVARMVCIYINGHIDCLLVFTTLCMLAGLHKERTSKYE